MHEDVMQSPMMAKAMEVPEEKHAAGIQSFLEWLRHHNVASADVMKVYDAIGKAREAGVSWLKVLLTLAPFILAVFTGGAVDIPAMIAAILALFNS